MVVGDVILYCCHNKYLLPRIKSFLAIKIKEAIVLTLFINTFVSNFSQESKQQKYFFKNILSIILTELNKRQHFMLISKKSYLIFFFKFSLRNYQQ